MASKLNQHERAGKLALVCVVVVFALEAASDHVAAFPSLFNVRAQSIFNRQQQPQQQQLQQHQPLTSNQHAQTLVPMASGSNGAGGIADLSKVQANGQQQLQFSASQLLPAELMRISSMQRQPVQAAASIGAHQLRQAFLNSAASHPQQQRHFIYTDNEHEAHYEPGAAQAAGANFYNSKPTSAQAQPMAASAAMLQHQQPLGGQEQSTSFELSDHTNYFSDMGDGASMRQSDGKQQTGASNNVNQLHLEPTHTSEIVDKIEHHIGQQIEHQLNNHNGQHHHNLHNQQTAASGYQQQAGSGGEKEAAQSEEQEETASGGSGGGESSSADESGDEKIEKRHEEPHKEHAESHKHEESHHHEHPPEAFEVHHKKGGKSFQYFHQGHHHHA